MAGELVEREALSIDLTPEALEIDRGIREATNIPKTAAVAQILNWFARLPPKLRLAVQAGGDAGRARVVTSRHATGDRRDRRRARASVDLWRIELPRRGGGRLGIPMASHIALGVMALAGRGVQIGVKVFLLAVAIVDDLGAARVIASFTSAKSRALLRQ